MRTLPMFVVAVAVTLAFASACGTSAGSGSASGEPVRAPASPGDGAFIGAMRIRDVATGARWDAVGRAEGGSDAGPALVPIAGYNQFWFAWSVFNDGSEVFGRTERVRSGKIAASGECGVPCDEIVLGCPGTDCIPALTRPKQVAPDSSEARYLEDRSYVVGVEIGGEARAYPHNVLWWHEVVNDVVRGTPIAITHCPLTFSSIAHDPTRFSSTTDPVELGVSGRLFDSNLVFYDRSDSSWYSQLHGRAVKGPALGKEAPRIHVFEMTWAAWRALHPSTTVLSSDTGHARSYTRYPYGSYFTDNDDTFGPTNPAPDPAFPAKALTYGVRVAGGAKAYVHDALAAFARTTYGAGAPPRGVVNDTIGAAKVAIVFDLDAAYVQAFDRTGQSDLELVR